ncbi:MAG TPA: 2-dehydropantoate 2-reductase [Candidatus Acidoferrales bacterium]|nr:2-dehydropantoate 2-reductase [Candidatus Acidoferrales bacterium]
MNGACARVAIIGGGAMGTFFGYALAQRHEVTIVDVRMDLLQTLQAQGLVVDEGPARKVGATADAAEAFPIDALFVSVKAQDTLRALRPFAGQLNPSTPIVSLQNGLGNEEAIKAALGGSVPLVLGITSEGCMSVGLGRSQRLAAGTTVLGSGGASQITVRWIATLLEGIGLSASVVYDIRPHLWGKLVANAAINPVAALIDGKNSVVARDRNASELAQALANECAAVAKALRINLPFEDAREYVRAVAEQTADTYNSMTLDLRAGQRTEIDQINGAIASAGRRVGIQTPYNEAVLRLIKARERYRE